MSSKLIFFQMAYQFKQKNSKLLMTILIFIIIPLASGATLGYEMCYNVTNNIPTVVVDHDNSSFSRSFIEYVSDNQYFNIVEYADNDDRANDMIYKGEAYFGIVIPENFYADMRAGKAPQILTVYDGSALAVLSSAKSIMSEILITLKSGYMINIYEGKLSVPPADVMSHAMPIDVTYRTLFNPTKNYKNYLLPGLLAAIIQVGIAIIGSERAWDKRDQKLKFTYHLKTIVLWGCMGAVSIFLCLWVQYAFFDLPYRGTLAGGLLLTVLFSICIMTLGYLIGSVINDRTFSTQLASILVLPTTILGGYMWPVFAMPQAIQYLAKILPFTYYGDAVRNLCMKELEFHHLIPNMEFMILCTGVELLALYFVKRKGVGQ